MDIRQLKDNIRNFSLKEGDLGSQGYTRVLLQLFGYTGHGKSSFINSCKYILEEGEEFKEYAEARETPEGLTMIRNAYPLTDLITFVDNRGCSKMDDFQRAEVYAQLGNFIPIGKEVVWKDNFPALMEDIENSESDPNYTDFIVPIFVYNARLQITDEGMVEVKTFLDNCVKMTGVFPLIVLTFKNEVDYLEIENIFRRMGAEIVISIENYSMTNHKKNPEESTDILKVIDTALGNVRFRLGLPRNQRKERIERKKFVLNYIYNISLRHEREKKERENERENQQEEENLSWNMCTIL